jgi:hypothetical protein
VLNSGASNTTDWEDSNSDGTPNNWFKFGTDITSSINSNTDGFVGNYLNITKDNNNTNPVFLRSDLITIETGKDYTIRFKYRTNNPSIILSFEQSNGQPIAPQTALTINTDDAVEVVFAPSNTTGVTGAYVYFVLTNATSGAYLQVDEIEIYEDFSINGIVNGSPTTTSIGESQEDYTYTSYYPICERAGTVLHDVMVSSIHASITIPVWDETLYGSDYLNQIGYIDKVDSDSEGYDWETIVNENPITLDNDTLVPLAQWEWVDLQDINGENLLDETGEQLQVKQNI